ncbi:MAG: endonuclease/exonuclease/phosphatase family protein, partial [Pirellulaceae bacterium]
YGLGILSKYPILAANEIKLPTGNEPRVALACKVQLPDDREIMVVNLHFDWVKDDNFRFQQAKALAKYLDNLTQPYVLMGDFNDQPQSRTLDLLSKGTLSAVKPSQDRFTFSSTRPTIEIDFIFAAPRKAWQFRFSRVLNGKLTSDHRPILAVLELKP